MVPSEDQHKAWEDIVNQHGDASAQMKLGQGVEMHVEAADGSRHVIDYYGKTTQLRGGR